MAWSTAGQVSARTIEGGGACKDRTCATKSNDSLNMYALQEHLGAVDNYHRPLFECEANGLYLRDFSGNAHLIIARSHFLRIYYMYMYM